MNRAYALNVTIFVPLALLLGNMWFFFDLIGQDGNVASCAQSFLWASLPHVLFTALFDVHKIQLNCFRLSYAQMLAQALGTALHIPILAVCLAKLPDEDSITAIGVATSISSLLKLLAAIGIGNMHGEIRASKMPLT